MAAIVVHQKKPPCPISTPFIINIGSIISVESDFRDGGKVNGSVIIISNKKYVVKESYTCILDTLKELGKLKLHKVGEYD